MPTIVLSPFSVINFSEGGGHFWVYMQYAQGLLGSGCDVYWVEAFRSRGSRELDELMLAPFRARMERFGLGDKLIFYPSDDAKIADGLPKEYMGLARSEAEAIFERADLLLNFHYAIAPKLLARFRRTALVDIDPGLLQFWISRGQLIVPRHDLYFTTGETVGTEAARFPDCGITWIPIRPPVSLEHWTPAFDPRPGPMTTVSAWDSDSWVVDSETRYENTKRVAFLPFKTLPSLTDQPLELALFLRTGSDARDQHML